MVSELKGMAHALAADGKELPIVASAIHRAYDDSVREVVTWESPDGTVENPAWTIEAIKRHLLFSNEFSELFSTAVDQIFHSLIVHLNDTVIENGTGLVAEDHRRALIDTISNFARWQQHCDRRRQTAETPGKKRKR